MSPDIRVCRRGERGGEGRGRGGRKLKTLQLRALVEVVTEQTLIKREEDQQDDAWQQEELSRYFPFSLFFFSSCFFLFFHLSRLSPLLSSFFCFIKIHIYSVE